MDGLEFTRRLKASEDTAGIQVIAFSTSNSLVDCEVAIDAGSDGFVHKPFTVRGLLQTVAWHVAARSAKRPVNAPSIDSSLNSTFGSFMKNSSKLLMALALMVGATSAARAQVNQTVNYSVAAINQIALTGSPTLTVNTATAGSAPAAATNNTSTWAVTTNTTGAKVSVKVSSALATGLTLGVTMGLPTGAAGGTVASLTTTDQDIVTGITKVAQSGLTVTYTLNAAVTAAVASGSATVVYTITTGT
jgi:hypothetical protein